MIFSENILEFKLKKTKKKEKKKKEWIVLAIWNWIVQH